MGKGRRKNGRGRGREGREWGEERGEEDCRGMIGKRERKRRKMGRERI